MTETRATITYCRSLVSNQLINVSSILHVLGGRVSDERKTSRGHVYIDSSNNTMVHEEGLTFIL